MNEIIYNYDSLFESDVNNIVKRAKALIINSKNEIAICLSHDNYFFIGGHVDNDESDYECLKREIKEESGIDIDIKINQPIMSIIYYNKDYPTKGVNTKSIANYYLIEADFEVNQNSLNLTADEKHGNFQVKFIDKKQIIEVLTNSLETSTRPVVVKDTIKVLESYLNKNEIDMKLQNDPFESIKNGEKTIEMRLYDEKRKKIKIGDRIIFTNVATEEKIETIVIGLNMFSSFEELYKHFDKKEIGYKESEMANFTDMEKYYSKEEQAKYGVVGIRVKYKY